MANKAIAQDSPSRLLTLPPELRLVIYNTILPDTPPGRFAYLYRSPGRLNQPGPTVPGPHLKLFWICRLIRHEALDEAFRNNTFVLEASLYNQPYGGLFTIPSRMLPIVWVKDMRKLVIFTVLDFGRARRMGDLWILQQMTGLEELWVNFKVGPFSSPKTGLECGLASEQNPIKALLDCIPQGCKLRIGTNEGEREVLLRNVGHSLRYIVEDEDAASVKELIEQEMDELSVTKGIFYGSALDHSTCGTTSKSKCCDGKACVNTCLKKKKKAKTGSSTDTKVKQEQGNDWSGGWLFDFFLVRHGKVSRSK